MPERDKKCLAIALIIILGVVMFDGWMNHLDQHAEKEVLYGQSESR